MSIRSNPARGADDGAQRHRPLLRGAIIGAVFLLLVKPPGWLADLVSPGTTLLVAVGLLATSLIVAAADPRVRPDSARPYVSAIPVTLGVWWWREPLAEWIASGGAARAAVVAVTILLGLLGVAELALATSIVGGFFAPDATILTWCAVPALAGLIANRWLVIPRAGGRLAASRYAGAIEIMIACRRRSDLASVVRDRPDLLGDDAFRAVDVMFDEARAGGDDLRADQLAVIRKFMTDARIDGIERALAAIPHSGPLRFQAPAGGRGG